jgi:hypothetical protein
MVKHGSARFICIFVQSPLTLVHIVFFLLGHEPTGDAGLSELRDP